MFKLYRYLKKYKKEVILGPMFKLIEAIFELIVPLVMASIIDKGIKELASTEYVLKMGAVLLFLAIFGLCSTLVCQVLASRASQGYGTILRNELYQKINSLSAKEIDSLGVSSLITRITTDVNQMQTSVAMLIRLVVRAPFLVIGSTIMAIMISPKISIIFIIAAVLIVLIITLVMKFSVPLSLKSQKKLDQVTMITKENVTGSRVIKAFNKEQYEKNRFDQSSLELQNTSIKMGRISALLNPCTSIIINLAVIAVLFLGGREVNVGNLTQGEITALCNYLSQILLAIIVVSNLVTIFTKASVSAKRINQVFALSSSIVDGDNEVNIDNDSIIEFDHVELNYSSNSKPSLSNITFKVKKGMTVGIIGGTGSGKTSIVNLIERFYDPTQGTIYLYGEDLKSYKISSFRNIIGLVPQKANLLSGTIRSNLLFSNKDATEEQMYKALDLAQCNEIIKNKEDGLDSVVLQEGRNFSGGQKQRLTIARALVKEPRILILDDSSSALDYQTDANLRHALKKLSNLDAVFIISQRATTLVNADLIIVLDNGRIEGLGKHEELLLSSKVYQEIYSSQTKEEK